MEYTGSTPMPFVDLSDDINWHSIPVKCLDANIRDVIKNKWKAEAKFVMVKTEMERITVLINGISAKTVFLYFE